MCYEAEYLMHLFACGSTGREAQPPQQAVDWATLVRLAREQSVVHMVALALKQNPQIPVPTPIRAELLSCLMGTAVRNKMRNSAILQLLQRMQDSGIQVLLLKGMAVARLYKNPECRESADTDILVLPQDEERALSFLQNEGFSVTPRLENLHHARCTHPTLGLFEVHISLWEEYLDALMFDSLLHNADLRDHIQSVQTEDGCFQTIGTDETLLFLTLHMMKHFIDNGISLRMVMDLSLYCQAFSGEVNTDGYGKLLQKLGFARTVSAVYHIAVRYFGFSETDFPCIGASKPEDMQLLLEDLFAGGWNGVNEKDSRFSGWKMYLKTKQNKNYGSFKGTFLRIRTFITTMLPILFPPRAELCAEYPVLKRFGILYPFSGDPRTII